MKITFDLTRALKKHGYKQKDVSEQTGLSTVCVNNACTGRISPNMEKVILIAEKMNIPIEDFFIVEHDGETKDNDIKCPYCHQPIDIKIGIKGAE